MRRTHLVSALMTTAALLDPVSAQQSSKIKPEPACPECRIELEHLVTLGSRTDSFFVAANSRLARDSRGRYFVAPALEPGRVLVFDSVGAELTMLGKLGEGPKELGRINSAVVDQYDSLHVFHRLRHTVFSPSLEFVRTARLPGEVGSTIFLDGERRIVNGFIATREQAGYPLHLFEGDSLVRSFGFIQSAMDPSAVPAMVRFMRVAPAGPEQVWLSHFNRYRLERWDAEGQQRQTLEREAYWFKPWEAGNSRYASKGGVVHQDESGRVWAVVAISRVLGTRRSNRPRSYSMAEDPTDRIDNTSYESMYGSWESMLEVIDPRTSQLVLSQRFPYYIAGFLSDDLVYRFNEDRFGLMVIEVHRIRLLQPGTR